MFEDTLARENQSLFCFSARLSVSLHVKSRIKRHQRDEDLQSDLLTHNSRRYGVYTSILQRALKGMQRDPIGFCTEPRYSPADVCAA